MLVGLGLAPAAAAWAQVLAPPPPPPPPPPGAGAPGVPEGMLLNPGEVEPPFDPFAQPLFEPSRDWGAALAELSMSSQGLAGAEANAWEQLMAAISAGVSAFEAQAGRRLRTEAGTLEPTLPLARMLDADDATDDERARASALMVELEKAGAWEKLDGLAKAKGAARPALKGLIAKVPLVDINNARHLGRALQWAMRDRAAQGDWPGFAAMYQRGLTLGRLYLRQAGPREFTVGTQVCEMALREAVRAAMLPPERAPDADTLRRCLEATLALPTADAGPSVAALRFIASDGVERCFPREVTPTQADARRGMRAIELLWARMEPAVAAPPAGRDAEVDKLSRWAAQQPPQLLVINIFGPEAMRVLLTRDLVNTLRAGAATMLALEIARAAASPAGLPAELKALTPDPLKQLPADPFSAEGAPLRYRVLQTDGAKADAAGRTYLLYSVGADGRDDNGEQHPVMNELALGRSSATGEGTGSDYIINASPRPKQPAPTPAPTPSPAPPAGDAPPAAPAPPPSAPAPAAPAP